MGAFFSSTKNSDSDLKNILTKSNALIKLQEKSKEEKTEADPYLFFATFKPEHSRFDNLFNKSTPMEERKEDLHLLPIVQESKEDLHLPPIIEESKEDLLPPKSVGVMRTYVVKGSYADTEHMSSWLNFTNTIPTSTYASLHNSLVTEADEKHTRVLVDEPEYLNDKFEKISIDYKFKFKQFISQNPYLIKVKCEDVRYICFTAFEPEISSPYLSKFLCGLTGVVLTDPVYCPHHFEGSNPFAYERSTVKYWQKHNLKENTDLCFCLKSTIEPDYDPEPAPELSYIERLKKIQGQQFEADKHKDSTAAYIYKKITSLFKSARTSEEEKQCKENLVHALNALTNSIVPALLSQHDSSLIEEGPVCQFSEGVSTFNELFEDKDPLSWLQACFYFLKDEIIIGTNTLVVSKFSFLLQTAIDLVLPRVKKIGYDVDLSSAYEVIGLNPNLIYSPKDILIACEETQALFKTKLVQKYITEELKFNSQNIQKLIVVCVSVIAKALTAENPESVQINYDDFDKVAPHVYADPTAVDAHGYTVFQRAVLENDMVTAKYFLTTHKFKNIQNIVGNKTGHASWSPLSISLFNRNKQMALMLAECGASFSGVLKHLNTNTPAPSFCKISSLETDLKQKEIIHSIHFSLRKKEAKEKIWNSIGFIKTERAANSGRHTEFKYTEAHHEASNHFQVSSSDDCYNTHAFNKRFRWI